MIFTMPDIIDGGDICLRWPAPGDEAAIFAAMQDDTLASRLALPRPYTMAMAAQSVARQEAKRRLSSSYDWAIISGGDFAGMVSLIIYKEDQRAELGYWLCPWARGRGICTYAVRLLIGEAFRATDIERIYAMHSGDNRPSGAVMERAGLQMEGVLRRHKKISGELQDIIYRGILRGEWVKLYGGGI